MIAPREEAKSRSSFGDLLDRFEKTSPEERQREIDQANAFLRDNGSDTLEKFDEWARK